jgi:N-acetylglucosamine kinase-like BadF-type ATPase
LKTALVAQLGQTTPEEARERLHRFGGQVRQAIESMGKVAAAPNHAGLVLGIDGGGSGTVAILARIKDQGWTAIGRGESGPSNLHATGNRAAFAALDQAIDGAFAAAKLQRGPVASACLGLAGAGRATEHQIILDWANRIHVAEMVHVTNDASLLLAAGTPDGWGLSVIAGTGSIACARGRDGSTVRGGGWGYLLGDEGSGYAIAVAGLQAVARAADGRGAATSLTQRFSDHFNLGGDMQALIGKVYGGKLDRPAMAALAPIVLQAADASDQVAEGIVEQAARGLAATAAAAARRLFECHQAVPVALAGGVLVSHVSYRQRFLRALAQCGVKVDMVKFVEEPAEGAVRLAMGHSRR